MLHIFRHCFQLFLWLFLLAGSALAQAPDKTLKQAAKALDGEKAFQRIASWHASGTLTRQRDGRNGKLEML